jgi:hypothetical protein
MIDQDMGSFFKQIKLLQGAIVETSKQSKLEAKSKRLSADTTSAMSKISIFPSSDSK